MSEPRDTPPRDPAHEGGREPPQTPTAPPPDPGLSKMGGGERRGDGLDDDARSGMIGEAGEADHGGMADEG
ncbi:hypothetical protein [Phenylobacterium sp.]|uniref:hypothetical protein n=1 Tax=Phenylobacterium sp. TaxID=1871053 RepID=UPI003919ABE3